ncbi:MAG: hypothetical protein J7J82_02240 [Staphylothermus sp.]|nr:hypothetical protein [Staphylothermus sp.]
MQKIDIRYVLTSIPSGKIYKYYYKGYPVYLNAVFLDTLVAYYKLTRNRYLNGIDILQLADRLAGLLIKAQWIYEHETPWGTIGLALYRGGWAAVYEPGSVKVEGSAWGIIDTATAGLDAIAGILAGIGVNIPRSLLPMPSEFPTIVNSESTILAIKALKDYKSLGRAPEVPTIIRPYHGEFYYGNGYGDGQGTTSTDGKTIKATISVLDFINTHYHYQYANYKLLINETSSVITFEYDIYGLLSYRAWSLDAGSYKISIFVKIWDPSGNKIEDHEYVISQGYLAQSSTSNFTTIHIRPSYCIIAEPGEYIIQISLYIAGKGWIDIDTGSDGSGNGLIIDQLNIYTSINKIEKTSLYKTQYIFSCVVLMRLYMGMVLGLILGLLLGIYLSPFIDIKYGVTLFVFMFSSVLAYVFVKVKHLWIVVAVLLSLLILSMLVLQELLASIHP